MTHKVNDFTIQTHNGETYIHDKQVEKFIPNGRPYRNINKPQDLQDIVDLLNTQRQDIRNLYKELGELYDENTKLKEQIE